MPFPPSHQWDPPAAVHFGGTAAEAENMAIAKLGSEKFTKAMQLLNPPVVVKSASASDGRNFKVFRDDVLVGGTKQRGLIHMILSRDSDEFVYAGPVFGFAQIALSHVCWKSGALWYWRSKARTTTPTPSLLAAWAQQ